MVVQIRHERLASPEEAILTYLKNHDEITNAVARRITGIASENKVKEAFYRLRDAGKLERVPGRLGSASAWRRSLKNGGRNGTSKNGGSHFATSRSMDGQVVRCPACGQANRVPPVGSGRKAVCGKCKSPLEVREGGNAGHPIVLTDATFAAAIQTGSYVVDFWAAWCGPCRMIAPIIDELAAERSDVTFAKLNVDENPRTATQFGVQGIPLLILFKNGAETGRVVGAVPRGQIETAIQRYLTGS